MIFSWSHIYHFAISYHTDSMLPLFLKYMINVTKLFKLEKESL